VQCRRRITARIHITLLVTYWKISSNYAISKQKFGIWTLLS